MKSLNFATVCSASTFTLSLLLAGCGGDSNSNATPKAATANLDGQYDLSQLSCTVGNLTNDAQALFNAVKFSLTIQGANMSMVGKISDNCSLTQALTVSELTSNSIATVEGATSCSAGCTPAQCQASAASNDKETDSYSVVNNVLTVIDSKHDEECQDSSGRIVHSWTKK